MGSGGRLLGCPWASVREQEASIDLQGTEVRLAGQEEESIREQELG